MIQVGLLSLSESHTQFTLPQKKQGFGSRSAKPWSWAATSIASCLPDEFEEGYVYVDTYMQECLHRVCLCRQCLHKRCTCNSAACHHWHCHHWHCHALASPADQVGRRIPSSSARCSAVCRACSSSVSTSVSLAKMPSGSASFTA